MEAHGDTARFMESSWNRTILSRTGGLESAKHGRQG